MKRIITLCLLTIMLCGCGNQAEPVETTTPNENITLWVVTEEGVWDGMNHQAQQRIEEFQSENENVTVNLDILPTEEEERAAYLETLRAQIMGGKGPDAYLLPTGAVLTLEHPTRYTYLAVEQLFSDVNLAMYNGIFADISEYYDADETLGKDGLKSVIMDAGCVADARYVLPLRYNLPVIYAHTEALNTAGLDQSKMASGILGLMDAAIEAGDPTWACCAKPDILYSRSALNVFSELIDYENQEVLITADELVTVMEELQTLKALAGENFYMGGPWGIGSYIQGGDIWDDNYCPMYTGYLTHSLTALSISHAMDETLTMIPLRAADGDLVAEIMYYAAVGASSDHPELAYAFLRGFLTEEYQWEQNRPKATANKTTTEGVIGGWPVRSDGAAKNLFRVYRDYYSHFNTDTEGYVTRRKKVLTTSISDEVIPVLREEIDRARFQLPMDWEVAHAMSSVTDPSTNLQAEDIQEAAEEIIRKLQWHVAEG